MFALKENFMAIEYVNVAELARRIGISDTMVRRYRDRGLFKSASGGSAAQPYDAAKCVELYKANLDPDAALKGIAGGAAVALDGRADPLGGNSLLRARTATAMIEAQSKTLHLKKLQGELISKADAKAAVRSAITIICERLDGAAGQIGPRVAGNPSAAECEQIARSIINDVRRDISAMADTIEAVGNAT